MCMQNTQRILETQQLKNAIIPHAKYFNRYLTQQDTQWKNAYEKMQGYLALENHKSKQFCDTNTLLL